MDSKSLEWTATITLPAVDVPHEAIHAFLRTSEFGEWHPDPEMQSDAFVLHYRRGRPFRRSGFFGFGTKLDWNVAIYPDGRTPVEDTRMFLKVTLRPSPKQVTVRLQHSATTVEYQALSPEYAKKCQAFEQQLEKAARGEAAALRAYLRDYYELEEPPALESE